MMDDFKIGDAVRLRMGGITELPLVIRSMKDSICLCVSECGNWSSWEADYSLELVNRPDPQADIKQAIREVLLSDEFIDAFTKKAFSTKLWAGLNYKPVSASDLAMWRMSEPVKEATNDPA